MRECAEREQGRSVAVDCVRECAEREQGRYVAVALALDTPAWYYSAKVSFVYINEFMHDMQRSQTFFTATELLVLVVLAAHVRRSAPLRPVCESV